MYINQFYELSMVLDREKFQKVFRSSCNKADYMMEKEGEYIDPNLPEKFIHWSFFVSKIKVLKDSSV